MIALKRKFFCLFYLIFALQAEIFVPKSTLSQKIPKNDDLSQKYANNGLYNKLHKLKS